MNNNVAQEMQDDIISIMASIIREMDRGDYGKEKHTVELSMQPCPCCGNSDIGLHSHSFCAGHGDYPTVRKGVCKKCGVFGPEIYNSEVDAILGWNKGPWNKSIVFYRD